jgi:hypothetical protein
LLLELFCLLAKSCRHITQTTKDKVKAKQLYLLLPLGCSFRLALEYVSFSNSPSPEGWIFFEAFSECSYRTFDSLLEDRRHQMAFSVCAPSITFCTGNSQTAGCKRILCCVFFVATPSTSVSSGGLLVQCGALWPMWWLSVVVRFGK